MYCDYCGQLNHDTAYRCARCRTRLEPQPAAAREPVITTAAVPKPAPAPQAAPPPRLRSHSGGGVALPQASRPVRQMSLLPGEPGGVARMEAYAPIRTKSRPPQAFAELKRRPSQGRAVSDLQASFDFAAPRPNNALSKATDFQGGRAPWPVLLAATVTDAAIVLLFTAIAALAGRQALISFVGVSPGADYLPAVGLTALVLSFLYKALWAMFGQVTPGLQAVGVDLIGFNRRRPGFAQRMIRVLVGWLGFFSCGLGMLFPFIDRNGLCWHDYASQSCYGFGPRSA
ncbi:MAG: hypothetical protein C0504_19840 [Candidatus Solibacter sp.]|nr:hypothetical protein [Candidatus Solibacter sp.]